MAGGPHSAVDMLKSWTNRSLPLTRGLVTVTVAMFLLAGASAWSATHNGSYQRDLGVRTAIGNGTANDSLAHPTLRPRSRLRRH
jgi:hypothetical protein